MTAAMYPIPNTSPPITKGFLNPQNTDFKIVNMQSEHSGDGHSELVEPHASGQNLEQGAHIGLSAYENGCVSITYTLEGPKGVNPPLVTSSFMGVEVVLLEWGYLGELGC